MEYTVIMADQLQKLINMVNARINEGWKPLGGIASIGSLFMQAMLKQPS